MGVPFWAEPQNLERVRGSWAGWGDSSLAGTLHPFSLPWNGSSVSPQVGEEARKDFSALSRATESYLTCTKCFKQEAAAFPQSWNHRNAWAERDLRDPLIHP